MLSIHNHNTIILQKMAEKNCEDLDNNVEDLQPLKTKLFTLHELPSVTQSEPSELIESLHSPKIIVEDRYEDTDGLTGRYAHSSDNHFFHSNNEPIKVTKVTKKSNKINSLVHFFERKYSPINEKGKGKEKLERHPSPKTEETHPITTVEKKQPEKCLRKKLFKHNKSILRQDYIDIVECSEQDKKKHTKQFKKFKAVSDDLNLSPSVDETNGTMLQAEAERKHNLHLNVSSDELTAKGTHIQNRRIEERRAVSDDLNLSPSVDETNETNETMLQAEAERKHNLHLNVSSDELTVKGTHIQNRRIKECRAASDDLNLSVDETNETKLQADSERKHNLHLNTSADELTVKDTHIQNRRINYRTGSRYSKNFDALVKMKAAFISGESDDKEEALDLFESNNHDPPLTADTNLNTVPDQIVSDEPSEVKLTPDTVSEKENVTSKQDASEIEEVVTGTPSDERALENWETAITATMMTKKNKSRKFGKREELRGRDDRIKELLDILTKHVRSIVELQEENTNLKKDLEEMESINSKQYELIFHLSKANINHYQHRSMDSGGEQSGKSEKFRKRGSKSLEFNFKQEMPDLIAGAEKAISDY